MFYSPNNATRRLEVALLTTLKPWGRFEQFSHNKESTIKIISVEPKSALSLQYHWKRDELWRGLEGKGLIMLDENIFPFEKDDMAWVPRGTHHRIITGDALLHSLKFHSESLTKMISFV
jgi:mannose-6-phosphate isomerase